MKVDKEYRFKLRGGDRYEAKMRDKERAQARKDKAQFFKVAPEKDRR